MRDFAIGLPVVATFDRSGRITALSVDLSELAQGLRDEVSEMTTADIAAAEHAAELLGQWITVRLADADTSGPETGITARTVAVSATLDR